MMLKSEEHKNMTYAGELGKEMDVIVKMMKQQEIMEPNSTTKACATFFTIFCC